MRAERDAQAAPMQSPVNWALLGLVIERPSYAYELAQRFERTYQAALTVSSISHVYTALAALRSRSLIEELPGTRVGRQPKPHYRATAKGLQDYGQWLIGQTDEDRRRPRLFVLQLATFTPNPQAALQILARYEQACLSEAQRAAIRPRDRAALKDVVKLSERLVEEENRLALGAKLAWVQYARQELKARTSTRASLR